MKIGVFLAYMPGVQLGSEGLGRYIGNLIKGFVDDENDVCVACPKWMVDSLHELFDDFHVSESSVEVITTRRVPFIWKLYSRFLSKDNQSRFSVKSLALKSVSDLVDFLIDKAISISSGILFGIVLLLLTVVILLLVPAALLLVSLIYLIRFVIWLTHKGREPVRKNFWKISDIHRRYSETGDGIQERAYKQLYQTTVKKLLSRINARKTDVWFVPTLFWPEAAKIKALTVFAAPDMVSVEFPFPFAESPGSVISTNICAKTVERGKYFVTYCDYIKKDLLMRQFCKPEDHIFSIAHINNSSMLYVDIVEGAAKYQAGKDQTVSDAFCRELLFRLPEYSTQRDFLNGFDFSHVEYIFYASQQRPHKNILNLIRAYEYLLRTENVHFKLFMTCDLDISPGIKSYIEENGLEHYVISFKRIPVQLLSALYQCATLVVNPTLYEGGFLTFTIGEGMSVGTPSVMSRIPQVTDMIPGVYPLEHILFDPHDYMDMAEKILYGVHNAKQLYQDELKMYQDIEMRTGPVVARDYIQAFKSFMTMNEKEKLERNLSASEKD